VRHLAPAGAPEIPAPAARRAGFTREVVEAATSRRTESSWCSAVRCIGRVGRKTCGGRIRVGRPEASRVEWSCDQCGEHGIVTGFEGTELDMSPYAPSRKKLRVWGIDDEERAVLLEATTCLPSLRAVVSRASPAAEVEGLLILQATVDELDEVYTLVEHLTDATRSRRRILLLDGMRASLCTAIDGF
jgi:hypothetical protein